MLFRRDDIGTDVHWDRLSARDVRVRSERRSRYLPMRDGTQIAIDVHLPIGEAKRPTIVRQTRYLRSLDARLPIASLFDLYARTRRVFVAAGYAWVDVDVRGTGASSGSWPCPWSPDEVSDGVEVVEWIVRQNWSNGRVGSLGISYDGTSADMLITARHPAVRAIAPLFSLYDVYADVAFPGGIHLAWFTEAWSRYNAALDRNAWHDAVLDVLYLVGRAGAVSPAPRGIERVFAPLARDRERFVRIVRPAMASAVRGVRRVDEDKEGSLLARALRSHRDNADIHAQALALRHRDQRGLSPVFPEETIDLFSPHAHRRAAEASRAAIYSISGWRDGAYPHSAIKRYASVRTAGSRLTLGPWVHSGRLAIEPFALAREAAFDFDADLLAFFDEHLLERARANREPVHYFTMGAGWSSASSWPPPGVLPRTFHLASERRLELEAPSKPGEDVHRERGQSGTGERSRWRSLISLVPGDYPDRAERDTKLLYWETPALDRALTVAGHPLVVLHVSWDDADDGQLFAYLEDVAPDGRVAYVTEGQLRAAFRRHSEPPCVSPAKLRAFTAAEAEPIEPRAIVELSFDLLPVSWLFPRGHRVRLALSGADRDHFATMSPRTFRVQRGRSHPSRIELPVL